MSSVDFTARKCARSPVVRHKKISLADKAAWHVPYCIWPCPCITLSSWNSLPLGLQPARSLPQIQGFCAVNPHRGFHHHGPVPSFSRPAGCLGSKWRANRKQLCEVKSGPFRSELGQLAANTGCRHSVPRQHSRSCSRGVGDSWGLETQGSA